MNRNNDGYYSVNFIQRSYYLVQVIAVINIGRPVNGTGNIIIF